MLIYILFKLKNRWIFFAKRIQNIKVNGYHIQNAYHNHGNMHRTSRLACFDIKIQSVQFIF